MKVRRTASAWAMVVVAVGASGGAQPRPRRVRDAGVDVPTLPPTHGSLAVAEVRRVIAPANGRVQQCYQEGLRRDPLLHGEVRVRLRVEADGQVSYVSASAEDAPAAMYRVATCIGEVLRTLRFPAPEGGPATVTVPYVFAANE